MGNFMDMFSSSGTTEKPVEQPSPSKEELTEAYRALRNFGMAAKAWVGLEEGVKIAIRAVAEAQNYENRLEQLQKQVATANADYDALLQKHRREISKFKNDEQEFANTVKAEKEKLIAELEAHKASIKTQMDTETNVFRTMYDELAVKRQTLEAEISRLQAEQVTIANKLAGFKDSLASLGVNTSG